jgi:hypothetical protein
MEGTGYYVHVSGGAILEVCRTTHPDHPSTASLLLAVRRPKAWFAEWTIGRNPRGTQPKQRASKKKATASNI